MEDEPIALAHRSPEELDIEVDLEKATALPLASLAGLGAGISSVAAYLAECLQVSTLQNSLAIVTDAQGMPLSLNALTQAKDNSGALGIMQGADGKIAGQARLQTAATMPTPVFDPSTLFAAAALMALDRKLSMVQKAVDDVMTYLVEQDMAQLRANIVTLENLYASCPPLWDNALFRQSAHTTVLGIRGASEASVKLLRAQIGKELDTPMLRRRADANARTEDLARFFREYQLSLHAYSYAYFLEVLLQEDYDEAYLAFVVEELRAHANAYRELYTRCYDFIEHLSGNSMEGAVLKGAAAAAKGAGGAIAKIPGIRRGPVDEALVELGHSAEGADAASHEETMQQLRDVKDTDVHSFIKSIEELERLHRTPQLVAADAENIYLFTAPEPRAKEQEQRA